MKGSKTMGVDQDGNDIDIEEMINEIARRKCQTVVSFIDCCRNQEGVSKGKGD